MRDCRHVSSSPSPCSRQLSAQRSASSKTSTKLPMAWAIWQTLLTAMMLTPDDVGQIPSLMLSACSSVGTTRQTRSPFVRNPFASATAAAVMPLRGFINTVAILLTVYLQDAGAMPAAARAAARYSMASRPTARPDVRPVTSRGRPPRRPRHRQRRNQPPCGPPNA